MTSSSGVQTARRWSRDERGPGSQLPWLRCEGVHHDWATDEIHDEVGPLRIVDAWNGVTAAVDPTPQEI